MHAANGESCGLSDDAAGRLLRGLNEPSGAPVAPGYETIAVLGEGGAGSVYLAVREGSDTMAALKVLRNPVDASDGQHRAWREIELLSKLRLPCVPRILDSGTHAGRTFIATDFVDGAPLDMTAANLDLRARVALLARVAEAVHEVHSRGIIHRDLKPSNILVTPQGDPVIIDFGLAALADSSTALTLTQDCGPRGTVAFMAPEQARGERDLISTRSDVYSLGATAMLLVCGEPPHAATDSIHEAIRRAAFDAPRHPRAVRADLDRSLAAVLAKACAREPASRYASAAEFAADLRRWLAGEPVLARPPGAWVRATRWVGRHPVVATGLACASVLALTVAITQTYIAWWNDRHRVPAYARHETKGRILHLYTAAGTWWGQLELDHGFIGNWIIIPPDANRKHPLLALLGDQSDVNGFAEMHTLHLYLLKETPTSLASWGPEYPEHGWPEHPDRPSTFGSDVLAVADVFSESPGEELITVHEHRPHSQTAIAIHDLGGSCLAEYWHDGYIEAIYWDARHRLLIAAGVNSDGDWRDRSKEDLPATGRLHPSVIFAIDPRVGEQGAIIRPGGSVATVEPVWYKCLLPSEVAVSFAIPAEGGLRPPDYFPATNARQIVAVASIIAPQSVDASLNVKWDVSADGTLTKRDLTDATAWQVEDDPEGLGVTQLFWGDLPAKRP